MIGQSNSVNSNMILVGVRALSVSGEQDLTAVHFIYLICLPPPDMQSL